VTFRGVNLVGAGYRLGGRDLDGGLDCLGVVLHVLEELGVPPELHPDPWRDLRELWASEGSAAALASTGFPAGWDRLEVVPAAAPQDGAVALLAPEASLCDHGHRTAGVGVVRDGRLWTSRPSTGVIAPAWSAVRSSISEVWAIR
jgi:hypothetical protein